MKRLEDVIRRPIIFTEKSTLCRRYGNQYIFAVDLKANKQEISDAVSELFNVKVDSVNTMVMPGKSMRFRGHMGHTCKWKKAIVTLADGQKIDFLDKVEEAGETAEA